MAVPTLAETMDAIFVDAQASFIPTRYPYTYGYDFLRNHFTQVVPQETREAIETPDLGSRASMAGFCKAWAEAEGIADYTEIVTVFADAYLLENSIPAPVKA